MKKHRNKIIAAVVVATALTVAFFSGKDAPNVQKVGFGTEAPLQSSSDTVTEFLYNEEEPESTPEAEISEQSDYTEAETVKKAENETSEPKEADGAETDTLQEYKKNGQAQSTNDEKVEVKTTTQSQESPNGRVNAEKSVNASEQKTVQTNTAEASAVQEDNTAENENEDGDSELYCTLFVSCATVLDNMELLDSEKYELIPSDGIILSEREVRFYEGESVFDVLVRELKNNKIHLEFESTPIYDSAYIEGIGNLYEFDCGELSGWMYKVNGEFPGVGCSRCILNDNDSVEWIYTCDLGADLGDVYSLRKAS